MERTPLTLLMLAMFAFTSAGCTSQSGDVTIYKVQCEGKVTSGRCDGKWFTLNPTTYTVFAEQQVVVYSSFTGAERLSNCAVRNIKNWKCEFSDHSAEFRMVDGEFSTIPNKDMASPEFIEMRNKARVVPWWRWAQIWWRESF